MSRAKAPPAEIPEDRPFQEQFWRAERVAWVGFVLLLLLAVTGLFGSGGPLSRATEVIDASRMDYPRFARWEAGDEFAVQLSGDGERRLFLSSAFSDVFQIEDIQPAPKRVLASASGHTYVFDAEGDATVVIRFAVSPRHPGLAQYSVAVPGGESRSVWSFVWP